MNSQPNYDTTITEINYSGDFEYRSWIRRVFCMASLENIDEDIDEISRDEMNFDAESTSRALDDIFENTKSHHLFQKLYESAAALMISVDHSIGLCVLFSYDYFPYFHRCLCCYYETPHEFTESHPSYLELHSKIT